MPPLTDRPRSRVDRLRQPSRPDYLSARRLPIQPRDERLPKQLARLPHLDLDRLHRGPHDRCDLGLAQPVLAPQHEHLPATSRELGECALDRRRELPGLDPHLRITDHPDRRRPGGAPDRFGEAPSYPRVLDAIESLVARRTVEVWTDP